MATSAQLREQIAAGRWDGPLAALYGTAPQELARQRARYCAALEQFELYFGPGREVQVYSAPGRAELGGNHTVHQHGYGLAAAVSVLPALGAFYRGAAGNAPLPALVTELNSLLCGLLPRGRFVVAGTLTGGVAGVSMFIFLSPCLGRMSAPESIA